MAPVDERYRQQWRNTTYVSGWGGRHFPILDLRPGLMSSFHVLAFGVSALLPSL
jgi:hypothetical protein